jgi:hypothetical protein
MTPQLLSELRRVPVPEPRAGGLRLSRHHPIFVIPLTLTARTLG